MPIKKYFFPEISRKSSDMNKIAATTTVANEHPVTALVEDENAESDYSFICYTLLRPFLPFLIIIILYYLQNASFLFSS